MRAIETVPFFLILVCIVSATVLVIGFKQFQIYQQVSERKRTFSSFQDLMETIERLRHAGYGSFEEVDLYISDGCELEVKNLANQSSIFLLKCGEKRIERQVPVRVKINPPCTFHFKPGGYKLSIYHAREEINLTTPCAMIIT